MIRTVECGPKINICGDPLCHVVSEKMALVEVTTAGRFLDNKHHCCFCARRVLGKDTVILGSRKASPNGFSYVCLAFSYVGVENAASNVEWAMASLLHVDLGHKKTPMLLCTYQDMVLLPHNCNVSFCFTIMRQPM